MKNTVRLGVIPGTPSRIRLLAAGEWPTSAPLYSPLRRPRSVALATGLALYRSGLTAKRVFDVGQLGLSIDELGTRLLVMLQPTRQRLLLATGQRGQVAFIAKSADIACLSREAEALSAVASASGFKAPRVIELRIAGSTAVLLTAPLSALWAFPSLDGVARACLDLVRLDFTHGDFAPWNVRWNGYDPAVFDWEHSYRPVDIGLDLVRYVVETADLKHWTANHLAAVLCDPRSAVAAYPSSLGFSQQGWRESVSQLLASPSSHSSHRAAARSREAAALLS